MRLIDADPIEKELKRSIEYLKANADKMSAGEFSQGMAAMATLRSIIREAPTVQTDAIGFWSIEYSEKYGNLPVAIVCSECGAKGGIELEAAEAMDWECPDFCPCCGAKMRKDASALRLLKGEEHEEDTIQGQDEDR